MKRAKRGGCEEDEMVETLVQWAEFITENGFEAALARADMEKLKRKPRKIVKDY